MKDLPDLKQVAPLLNRYGYGITAWCSEGVGLYRRDQLRYDGTVPVDAWVFLSSKEFSVVRDLLLQLEAADSELILTKRKLNLLAIER